MTGERTTLGQRLQRGLPLLLLAFALLLAAAGGKLLRGQQTAWQKHAREEQAREILDGITARPRFIEVVERIDQLLMRDLAAAEHRRRERFLADGRRDELPIQTILGRHLRPPFPPHEFWFFSYSGGTPRLLLAPLDSPHGKRIPSMAFDALVARHLGRKQSSSELTAGDRKVESLFGPFVAPELLAREQRGRATLIIYRRRQHWLVWNVLHTGGEPQCGYFLLIPHHPAIERTGLALSLRDLGQSRLLGGYVSLFKPLRGDVLTRRLERSSRFREWRRSWASASRRRYLENPGPPWGEPVGTHLLYSRIMPQARHLAVLLLPAVEDQAFPAPAFFALGFSLFVVFRLLGEGLLLDRWPRISLRWRFFLLMAVAAGIPLGLAWSAGHAYLFERRETLFRDLRRHLVTELDRADQGKELLLVNYLEAFHRTISHLPLLEALRIHGLAAPRLMERMTELFTTASPSLPLSFVGIYDAKGKHYSGVGTGSGAVDLSNIMPFFKVNFARCLVERQRRQNPGITPPKPEFTTEDLAVTAVYETASANDARELIEQRRGQVQFIQFGRRLISTTFEFLRIDEIDRYVLFLAWTNEALEALILDSAQTTFAARNPGFRFAAFRNVHFELQPADPHNRENTGDMAPTAQAALVREGMHYRYDQPRERLYLARPSRNLPQIILAATAETGDIESELRHLRWGLQFAIALSLLGIAAIGVAGGRQTVEPLLEVQQGVEQVTRGRLDGELALDRHDELGRLSRAFDAMVDGLRTRARLSTLVSGQALPTLATVDGPGAADETGRRFHGVVLVSDLRDFTTLCEQRPVDEITDLLNRHFERMAAIITRRGGRIDKFIGDAIQAVFTDESAAERALGAAREMITEMAAINHERTESGRFPYRLGIGLASSELILGPVGDPETRFDLVLMGRGVEQAAQLEALSKKVPWYPIVLDPETAAAAGIADHALIHGPEREEGPTFIFPRSVVGEVRG